MAIGTKSNFIIYHEEFWAGMGEVLAQNADAFNAASGNTIRQVTRLMRGDYERESFMKSIAALSARRDITATTTVADTALTQDEIVAVKLNRRLGPVANTLDSFRKIAPDEDAQRLFSFQLGRQMAQAVQLDMLNAAIKACEAALDAQAAIEHDATDGTIQFTDLVDGLAKFGDRSTRIIAWVMHSKPFFDLFKDGLANYKIENVAGFMIVTGNPLSLGKPVVVTDSSDLVDTSASPDEYSTLGLVEDAIEVAESEEREITEDLVTGLENLVLRIQGEYAYNIKLKGFKWDITNGGANPDDTALGTGTNWDKAATDNRDLAGILIKSQ